MILKGVFFILEKHFSNVTEQLLLTLNYILKYLINEYSSVRYLREHSTHIWSIVKVIYPKYSKHDTQN